MEIKTIVTVIIAGMLGAVVFAGLLPVFAETSSATDTFTNKGYFDLTYTETDDITLFWDYTKPTQVTINDVDVPLPPANRSMPKTLMCGDTWVIREIATSSGAVGLDYYSSTTSTGTNETLQKNMTVTASGGSVTITVDGSTPKTDTYTYLYCISDNGEYVMKDAGESVYVKNDSPIYAMGITFGVWEGVNVYLKTTGTIEDGLTPSVFGQTGTAETITADNLNVNYSEVNRYVDLYSLSGFTVDVTDGENTATVTYTYFIVPVEVTAEKEIHPDGPTTALLNLLPVLIAIGLIVGIAGAIFVKRM